MKILLSLMAPVVLVAFQAQAQATIAVMYDGSMDDDITLHGGAVQANIVVYGDLITVSAMASHAVGKADYYSWSAFGTSYGTADVSRTYGGIGPGVIVKTDGPLQMFAHILFGGLQARVDNVNDNKYGERYGGGFDLVLSKESAIRVSVDFDGRTHLLAGVCLRF